MPVAGRTGSPCQLKVEEVLPCQKWVQRVLIFASSKQCVQLHMQEHIHTYATLSATFEAASCAPTFTACITVSVGFPFNISHICLV